jgi:hypothetical protein
VQWAWQGDALPAPDDIATGLVCAFTPKAKACASREP